MTNVIETMKEVPVNDLTEVLVIGYNPATDQMTIHPSRKRFDFCHQMINRAMIELVLFEKESAAVRMANAQKETEPAPTTKATSATTTGKPDIKTSRSKKTKSDIEKVEDAE